MLRGTQSLPRHGHSLHCTNPPINGAASAALRPLCVCTGLETAITRTPLSTTLILANLSGHTGVIVPCLASALVSLFLTLNHPFISSQQDRSDVTLKVCIFCLIIALKIYEVAHDVECEGSCLQWHVRVRPWLYCDQQACTS